MATPASIVVISELSDDDNAVFNLNDATARALAPDAPVTRLNTKADFLELFDSVVNLKAQAAHFHVVYIGHGDGNSLCFQDGDLTPDAFLDRLHAIADARTKAMLRTFAHITLTLEACYGHNFQQAVKSDLSLLGKQNVLQCSVKSAASDNAATVDMSRVINGGMDRLMLNTATDFAASLAKAAADGVCANVYELLYIMQHSQSFYDRVTTRTMGAEHLWAFRGDFTGKTVLEFFRTCDRISSDVRELLQKPYAEFAAVRLNDLLRLHCPKRIPAANDFIALLKRLDEDTATDAEKEDAIDMDLVDNPTTLRRSIRRMVARRVAAAASDGAGTAGAGAGAGAGPSAAGGK